MSSLLLLGSEKSNYVVDMLEACRQIVGLLRCSWLCRLRMQEAGGVLDGLL